MQSPPNVPKPFTIETCTFFMYGLSNVYLCTICIFCLGFVTDDMKKYVSVQFSKFGWCDKTDPID